MIIALQIFCLQKLLFLDSLLSIRTWISTVPCYYYYPISLSDESGKRSWFQSCVTFRDLQPATTVWQLEHCSPGKNVSLAVSPKHIVHAVQRRKVPARESRPQVIFAASSRISSLHSQYLIPFPRPISREVESWILICRAVGKFPCPWFDFWSRVRGKAWRSLGYATVKISVDFAGARFDLLYSLSSCGARK